MEKADAINEILKLDLCVGDAWVHLVNKKTYNIHDITAQPNTNDTSKYHVRIGLIDIDYNPISEELSEFYKFFSKI